MSPTTTLRVLPALLAMGCAPDLRERVAWSNGSRSDNAAPVGVLDTGVDLSEVTEVVLDASDHEAWVRYDFERVGVVDTDLPWDIAVRRYVVVLNGGVSGDGPVEAAVLPDADFDSLETLPDGLDWRTDAEDADGDGEDETVLAAWYDYDPSTHVLTANGTLYLVRTAEGAVVKLELLDYYDEAGSPGHVHFRWAQIAPAP